MSSLDFEISDEDIKLLELSEKLTFDSTRSEILKSLNTIDVQACPGSGKTTLIASKLLLLSQKWSYKNQGICVLSHTNVAKNEIIDKLKKSSISEAQRLLSYPHFIGTIQEFVNKHLAIPYLRSLGIEINLIDTERCVELIYSKLDFKTKAYIDKKNQYSNVLFDFNLEIDNDYTIKLNVPTFPNGSNSPSYKKLKSARENLISEGYLFYRDLYVFAEKLLISASSVQEYIQKRYPIVFIDEMQDTQKFQDDLLQQIFPLKGKVSSIQRFGDPDQAIFNGINKEEPNKTYNQKPNCEMNFIIDKSHRFDDFISKKIKNLSFNQIELSTDLLEKDIENRKKYQSETQNFKHSVLIYRNETIIHVIPKFASLVFEQFSQNKKNAPSFTVKAIGAVGNEIDPNDANQLKIGHYWKHYNKEKSTKSFKGIHLIEEIYYIRTSIRKDCSDNYQQLLNSILKLLQFANLTDIHGKFFNARSLKDTLVTQKKWRRFRKILAWFINSNNKITFKKWKKARSILGKIIGFDHMNESITTYLEYKEEQYQNSNIKASSNTLNLHGIKIELSTIHGVKGETHDATLVLETKNHCYDLGVMLPYLCEDLPSIEKPNKSLRENPSHNAQFKSNQKFMRQLYVAMSRPKHLLCFAINENRISKIQREKLENLNWYIYDIKDLSLGEN